MSVSSAGAWRVRRGQARLCGLLCRGGDARSPRGGADSALRQRSGAEARRGPRLKAFRSRRLLRRGPRPLRRRLRIDDGAPHLDGRRLLELATLRELIDRFVGDATGRRAARRVSMWSQLAFFERHRPGHRGSARGARQPPVSLADGRFALHDNGCTAGVVVAPERPLTPCRAEAGFEAMIEGHLSPLIALLAGHSACFGQIALETMPPSAWPGAFSNAPPIRASIAKAWPRPGALDRHTTTAGRKNPLRRRLAPSALAPMESCQRKICCLRYLLPGMADCGRSARCRDMRVPPAA